MYSPNVFTLHFVVQSEHAVSEAGEPAPSVAPGEEEEGKEEVSLIKYLYFLYLYFFSLIDTQLAFC